MEEAQTTLVVMAVQDDFKRWASFGVPLLIFSVVKPEFVIVGIHCSMDNFQQIHSGCQVLQSQCTVNNVVPYCSTGLST